MATREVLDESLQVLYEQMRKNEHKMLNDMAEREVYSYLISKLNYFERKNEYSCKSLKVNICRGDICFIDYGAAYKTEIGYQHFGLILSFSHNKAFVVPISGSTRAYENAPNKPYMMRIGQVSGLTKRSVVYLNDAKWINTSRIIDVKAHLDTQSILFRQIRMNVINLI